MWWWALVDMFTHQIHPYSVASRLRPLPVVLLSEQGLQITDERLQSLRLRGIEVLSEAVTERPVAHDKDTRSQDAVCSEDGEK